MRAACRGAILQIDTVAGVTGSPTGSAGQLDMQAEHPVDITEVFAWSDKLARDPAPPVQVAPAPAPAVQGPAPAVQGPAPAVQVARAPDRAVPALDAERE